MYKLESNHFKSKAVISGILMKFDEQTKTSYSQKFYKVRWMN